MDINHIYQGTAIAILKTFADASIDCCVTSPPYWGLRDYGTALWIGGDKYCLHQGKPFRTKENINNHTGTGVDKKNKISFQPVGHVCPKCGAIRIDDQLGLERTPEEFVNKMVLIFEEIRRILKPTGTLWLNLGDSYAGSGKGSNPDGSPHKSKLQAKQGTNMGTVIGLNHPNKAKEIGLKPKDLVGIPWMIAFALRNAGWYLRQDIIWNKPNPMPESVTDRCTKAHEYIFLLSKSQKYYYDQESILEECSTNTHLRISQDIANQIGSFRANGGTKTNGPMKAVVRTPKQQSSGSGIKNNDSFANATCLPVEKRNKRSVWTVPTQSFKEAHFATYPEELIEDCIKAGCPKNGIVLDPFMGGGTTAVVARKLMRNFIGIELNPEYIKIAEKRLHDQIGLFLNHDNSEISKNIKL